MKQLEENRPEKIAIDISDENDNNLNYTGYFDRVGVDRIFFKYVK